MRLPYLNINHRQPNVIVACAQAHVAQNYTIPRLRHMCLCAGNHNIGLPMYQLKRNIPQSKIQKNLKKGNSRLSIQSFTFICLKTIYILRNILEVFSCTLEMHIYICKQLKWSNCTKIVLHTKPRTLEGFRTVSLCETSRKKQHNSTSCHKILQVATETDVNACYF